MKKRGKKRGVLPNNQLGQLVCSIMEHNEWTYTDFAQRIEMTTSACQRIVHNKYKHSSCELYTLVMLRKVMTPEQWESIFQMTDIEKPRVHNRKEEPEG